MGSTPRMERVTKTLKRDLKFIGLLLLMIPAIVWGVAGTAVLIGVAVALMASVWGFIALFFLAGPVGGPLLAFFWAPAYGIYEKIRVETKATEQYAPKPNLSADIPSVHRGNTYDRLLERTMRHREENENKAHASNLYERVEDKVGSDNIGFLIGIAILVLFFIIGTQLG